MIAAQTEEIKSTSSETAKVKREALIETLVVALGEKNLFSDDDKKQMRYLLGQSMYEMGKYGDAVVELKDFVGDFPSDAEAGKAHLIIAHCLLKKDFDPHLFVEHAEKAIELDPTASKGLHLQLYNTYLALAEQSPDQEKASLIDQAANHLFFSLGQGVKKENRLWLAHYYFQRYEQTRTEQKALYLDRAIAVLENVLQIGEDPCDLTISPQTLDIEGEAIKLSFLYSDANRLSDAIGILSALKREYEARPQLNWNYRRLALFELGQNYEKIVDVDEAIRTYDSLQRLMYNLISALPHASRKHASNTTFSVPNKSRLSTSTCRRSMIILKTLNFNESSSQSLGIWKLL